MFNLTHAWHIQEGKCRYSVALIPASTQGSEQDKKTHEETLPQEANDQWIEMKQCPGPKASKNMFQHILDIYIYIFQQIPAQGCFNVPMLEATSISGHQIL